MRELLKIQEMLSKERHDAALRYVWSLIDNEADVSVALLVQICDRKNCGGTVVGGRDQVFFDSFICQSKEDDVRPVTLLPRETRDCLGVEGEALFDSLYDVKTAMGCEK